MTRSGRTRRRGKEVPGAHKTGSRRSRTRPPGMIGVGPGDVRFDEPRSTTMRCRPGGLRRHFAGLSVPRRTGEAGWGRGSRVVDEPGRLRHAQSAAARRVRPVVHRQLPRRRVHRRRDLRARRRPALRAARSPAGHRIPPSDDSTSIKVTPRRGFGAEWPGTVVFCGRCRGLGSMTTTPSLTKRALRPVVAPNTDGSGPAVQKGVRASGVLSLAPMSSREC